MTTPAGNTAVETTVIATDTFIAFVHPRGQQGDGEFGGGTGDVGLDKITGENFTLRVNGEVIPVTDAWALSYIPDRHVTLLIPPPGVSISDLGSGVTDGTTPAASAPPPAPGTAQAPAPPAAADVDVEAIIEHADRVLSARYVDHADKVGSVRGHEHEDDDDRDDDDHDDRDDRDDKTPSKTPKTPHPRPSKRGR